jgi:4-amino-4-deoxy-L-arabinose transferase-like glycosyltransferase
VLSFPYFESGRNRLFIIVSAFAVFVAYKFNDIFLPYFWDEMAGYMSGVIYMLDHRISLLPSAVPAELSYGHPLMVHFIMANVASVFGCTPASMHITTLLFAFFMAFGTYLLAWSLTKNYTVAIIAYILCLAQPVVLAQSTQVLLEMFLALTFVYAIYFYTRQKYIYSVFFCVLAVLTKETGLVMAIAFMVQHSIDLMIRKDRKKWLYLSLLYLLPFLVFAGFILVQKSTYGWYLNPVNVGKSKLEIGSMVQKIWDYPLEFTFINQGRFVLSFFMFLALIWYVIKHKRIGAVVYQPAMMLIIVFCFGFIVFSSIADALERYFLSLIPFAMILFAVSIWSFRQVRPIVPVIILAVCLLFNFLYIDNGKKYADADMSYRHLVKTNQMVFDHINSGAFKGETIGFSFPLLYAPQDTRFGYFKQKNFISDSTFSDKSKYFIFCSPGNLDWNIPDTLEIKPVIEFRSGYSRALIYKKISF